MAIGIVVACVPLADAAKDDLTFVSRQSAADGAAAADALSFEASISGDGRFVAFSSSADNLSAADNDAAGSNTFVRDLQADTTILVSRQSASDGGAGAATGSFSSRISANGRYVVFGSNADNLSSVDDNSPDNLFVRDLQTNSTSLVSRQSAGDGGAGADDDSLGGAISADGRYIAFNSFADNLSAVDNNAFNNVFVRDTQTNSTILVSRRSASDGGATADDVSETPSISADGRYVAFFSDADNLSSADNNAVVNIFLRDLQTNTTTVVSRQSSADGGAGGDGHSSLSHVSGDGRYVAFSSSADNLSTADNNAVDNIFVRDMQTNTTTLVSRQSVTDGGAAASGGSDSPRISADGRYVAFGSGADNLSTADDNAVLNIFVRDMQTDTTVLVSRQAAGDGGGPQDGSASSPSISADGRFVSFGSDANNLSSFDSDGIRDVFVRDVLGPPASTETPPTETPPIAVDSTPPVLDATTKSKQQLGTPLTVTVACDEACTVDATATAKPSGHAKRAKKLKFSPASAQLAAGAQSTLKLKPSKKTARKLRAAAKAKAAVVLTAVDAAGNSSSETLKIKLR